MYCSDIRILKGTEELNAKIWRGTRAGNEDNVRTKPSSERPGYTGRMGLHLSVEYNARNLYMDS